MQILLDILKFGLFNCFLIGTLFLVNKRGNVAANRYYGILVWLLSIVVLESLLILSGDIFLIPHLFSAGSMMLFLIPPFSYLLQQSLLQSGKKTEVAVLLLHCVPFLLCSISLLPVFLKSGEAKAEIIKKIYYENWKIEWKYMLYSAGNIIQFIVYHILIIRIIKSKSKQPLKKALHLNLSWLGLLMFVMNALVLVYLLLYLSFVYSTAYNHQWMLVFIILMLLVIYLTSFQLIKNPFFFSRHESIYKRSTLKKEMADALEGKLSMLLEEQKPYLKPRLKLSELAQLLHVTPHQLSQFLNQKKDASFNQMINTWRVKHAKDLLQDDKENKKTILAVALESGFSNQANFIRVFKSATGLTPSQYRISGP